MASHPNEVPVRRAAVLDPQGNCVFIAHIRDTVTWAHVTHYAANGALYLEIKTEYTTATFKCSIPVIHSLHTLAPFSYSPILAIHPADAFARELYMNDELYELFRHVSQKDCIQGFNGVNTGIRNIRMPAYGYYCYASRYTPSTTKNRFNF